MRKAWTLAIFCFAALATMGQTCPDCRFSAYVFDSVSVQTVQFGSGVNADGNPQDLFMDIYEPYGDTASDRPVIVFAFGGGFVQGDRNEGYVVSSCKRFARAGYVVAAIDYRIGFSIPGLFPNPTEELMRVFFRAMQDMRGSVQWMRAHADVMGNTLRIDPDKIIIGGASAGAITACLVAYCDKSSEFAEIGDTSAIDQLGGFYSSSGTYSSYSWEPQMVFNIAGAVVNVNWIDSTDVPIYSAHGDQDATVPYQGGNFDLGFSSVGLEGSYNIHQHAQSIGLCSYLYTMVGEDHPSSSASKEYYDEIFNRAMPRMRAVVEGKSFCCPLEVDIVPAGPIIQPSGTVLNLQSTLVGDSGSATVRWCEETCGITVLDSVLSSIPTHVPGYFIATVQEGNCVNTDFVAVQEPTVSILEPLNPIGLQCMPVPARDWLTVRRDPGPVARLEIMDAQGKRVYDREMPEHEVQIYVQDLPPGTYLLRLHDGEQQAVRKFILH